MGKLNFTDEFKREAVAQIVERGYSTAEVYQRLGVAFRRKFSLKLFKVPKALLPAIIAS